MSNFLPGQTGLAADCDRRRVFPATKIASARKTATSATAGPRWRSLICPSASGRMGRRNAQQLGQPIAATRLALGGRIAHREQQLLLTIALLTNVFVQRHGPGVLGSIRWLTSTMPVESRFQQLSSPPRKWPSDYARIYASASCPGELPIFALAGLQC